MIFCCCELKWERMFGWHSGGVNFSMRADPVKKRWLKLLIERLNVPAVEIEVTENHQDENAQPVGKSQTPRVQVAHDAGCLLGTG